MGSKKRHVSFCVHGSCHSQAALQGMCRRHHAELTPGRRPPTREPWLELIAAIIADTPKLDGPCKTMAPRIFEGRTEADIDAALAACNSCGVRRQCAAWAMSETSGVTTGVVGGLVLDVPARQEAAS